MAPLCACLEVYTSSIAHNDAIAVLIFKKWITLKINRDIFHYFFIFFCCCEMNARNILQYQVGQNKWHFEPEAKMSETILRLGSSADVYITETVAIYCGSCMSRE